METTESKFETELRASLEHLANAMVLVEKTARNSKDKKVLDGWCRLRQAKDHIRWVGSFYIQAMNAEANLYDNQPK